MDGWMDGWMVPGLDLINQLTTIMSPRESIAKERRRCSHASQRSNQGETPPSRACTSSRLMRRPTAAGFVGWKGRHTMRWPMPWPSRIWLDSGSMAASRAARAKAKRLLCDGGRGRVGLGSRGVVR